MLHEKAAFSGIQGKKKLTKPKVLKTLKDFRFFLANIFLKVGCAKTAEFCKKIKYSQNYDSDEEIAWLCEFCLH